MRNKHFIALLATAASLLTVVGIAGPASADASSDQTWSNLVTQELNYGANLIDTLPTVSVSNPSGDVDLGIPAIAYSYRALVDAERAGWNFNDPTVDTDMDKVKGLYTSNNGNGISGFISGQASRQLNILTVTQTDHVGPLMLKAAQYDPTDYGPWVNKLVDSIMSERLIDVNVGGTIGTVPCINYDDTTTDMCAVNVAVGASDFLQRAWNMGYKGTGHTDLEIQNVINGGVAIANYAFGLGDAHWFPYSLNPDGSIGSAHNDCGQLKEKTPQDWNHESYTIESAVDLGLKSLGTSGVTAQSALDYHLNHPEYNSGGFNGWSLPDECLADLDAARDIKGRLRMEYLDPATTSSATENPNNTYTDVNWMLDTWGTQRDNTGQLYHTASQALQVALFSQRLVDAGSSPESIADFPVDHIDAPLKRCGDNTWCGDNTTGDGVTVTIDSFVRNNLNVGIVDRTVSLRLAGLNDTILDTKPTGLRGNVSFSYTMPSKSGATKCFLVHSANGTDSPKLCLTTR